MPYICPSSVGLFKKIIYCDVNQAAMLTITKQKLVMAKTIKKEVKRLYACTHYQGLSTTPVQIPLPAPAL